MATIVGFHCDIINCELAPVAVVESSTCGCGNAVSLTAVLDQGQFFSFLSQISRWIIWGKVQSLFPGVYAVFQHLL